MTAASEAAAREEAIDSRTDDVLRELSESLAPPRPVRPPRRQRPHGFRF